MNYEAKRFIIDFFVIPAIIDFCVILAIFAVLGIAGYAAGATDEKDKIHAHCVEKGFGTEDECRSLVIRGVQGKWEWKFSL